MAAESEPAGTVPQAFDTILNLDFGQVALLNRPMECAVANLGLLDQLTVHTPVSHFLIVIQLWLGMETC